MRKELRRKDAVYYSAEFVGAEKLLFTSLTSPILGLQGNVDCTIKTAKGEYIDIKPSMKSYVKQIVRDEELPPM